ncbi:MAG: ATP-binding cassette domain-containing protein [Gammaproteobacteria bacterium]|nr:ATP-binding cassette domain-containing protein [Gammaproteobacteria bacterium]
MLKLVNVGKIYSQEGNVSVGIRKVNLEFNIGEFVAITGESGSGKTTLLNVLSGIDTYEEGEMYVNGEETSYYNTEDLEDYRNKYVGFIFQNYNIVDSYTVKQNVEAALILNGYKKDYVKSKAKELIEKVGLTHKMNTKSSKLSGGEKQRVVIARALAKDPLIIAADEPTGNLDSKSGEDIINLLHEISKDKLVLIVTHNYEEVEGYATRLIRVYDGEIKEDRQLSKYENKDKEALEIFEKDDLNKKEKKNLFAFNLRDLFASPKKFIFNLIVYFIMSLIVLLSVGFYRNMTRSQSMSLVQNVFENNDALRLIVNKKDKSAFTDAELNDIKNNSSVDFIVEKDVITDRNIDITTSGASFDQTPVTTYILNADVIKDGSIKCGRKPSNDDEVVISLNKSELSMLDFYSYDDLLNKKMYVSRNYYGMEMKGEYTICGVISLDNLPSGIKSYVYLNSGEYEKARLSYYLNSYIEEFSIKGKSADDQEVIYYLAGGVKNIFKLEIDNTIEKGKYKVALNGAFAAIDPNTTTKFYANDNTYGVILDKELTFLEVISTSTEDGLVHIYLNSEDYNEINKAFNTSYQISVYTTSISKNGGIFNNLQKELSSKGYRVISASAQTEPGLGDNVLSLVYLILILNFLVGTFFIVFATLVHSAKSKSDDIEILRTIGATKQNIRNMLITEYMTIGVIAYIMSMVALFIARIFASGEFRLAIEYLELIDYTIVFVLVMLMSFLLSLMFVRSIFKKSVRKGLSDSRRS